MKTIDATLRRIVTRRYETPSRPGRPLPKGPEAPPREDELDSDCRFDDWPFDFGPGLRLGTHRGSTAMRDTCEIDTQGGREMRSNTRHHGRFAVLAALTMITAMLTVPRALAVGPSCSWDPATRQVTIGFAGSGSALLARDGATITMNGDACLSPGLTFATVLSARRVVVNGDGAGQAVYIDLVGGRFAPGYGDEAGSSDELEIGIDLGGGDDALEVRGSIGNDRVRLGTTDGAVLLNLNANEGTGIDADVIVSNVEHIIRVLGRPGDDVLSAAGGKGTGGVLTHPVELSGVEGNDVLVGGAAADSLYDGDPADHDVARGRGGDDWLDVRDLDGDDDVFGGGGADTCFVDGGDTQDSC